MEVSIFVGSFECPGGWSIQELVFFVHVYVPFALIELSAIIFDISLEFSDFVLLMIFGDVAWYKFAIFESSFVVGIGLIGEYSFSFYLIIVELSLVFVLWMN